MITAQNIYKQNNELLTYLLNYYFLANVSFM